MKIKVLHIISGDLWAGAESQAYTLLANLAKHPCVAVEAVVLNKGELENRLRMAGIIVHVIEEGRHSFIGLLFYLWLHIRRRKPDLIHTHRFKENIVGSLVAKVVGGVRSVRTMHGAPEHLPRHAYDFRRILIYALDKWCAAYLQSAIIVVSSDLARICEKEFINTPIVTILNGVDSNELENRRLLSTDPLGTSDCWKIGIVGRLVPVKRVDLFLEIAFQLNTQYSELFPAEFHVIGDGPLREKLVSHCGQLGLSGAITFHGHIKETAEYIEQLDIVVICSEYEGLPMVALEALSLGTVVVAHCVGGLPELLSTSCLVYEQTAEAYVKRIVEVLKRLEVNDNGKKASLLPQKYSAEGNARKIYDLYIAVLKGEPPIL